MPAMNSAVGRFLFLIALIFLPSPLYAYSLESIDGSRVAAFTSTATYRLSDVAKPWQLSALPGVTAVDQPTVFNGKVFLVVAVNGQSQAWESDNGLHYGQFNGLAGEAIRFKALDQNLLIGLEQNGVVRLLVLDANGQMADASSPDITALTDLDRVAKVSGVLILAKQLNSSVVIEMWNGTSWAIGQNLLCTSSQLLTRPTTALICNADQVYQALGANTWQPVFPGLVTHIANSPQLLAGSDAVIAGRFYVLNNNQLISVDINLGALTVTNLQALGSRVLSQLSDGSYRELDYLNQQLLPTAFQHPTFVVADNDNRIFYKDGSLYAYSDNIGVWQTVTVDGDFNAARRVNGGWLLWKVDGSLTEFASDSSNAFHKITTAWSTSSHIQDLLTTDAGSLILILNSSHNPNVYFTSDYLNWTKQTLPTQPTYSLSINDTRQLPANSLAEVTGAITVGNGVVGSGILYLQDQSGGIQIYLDSSKGELPSDSARTATATGQLSTSQTKRLILGSASDLSLLDPTILSFSENTVDQLLNALGSSFMVSGTVTALSSDSLTLGANGSTIKTHFTKGSLDFRVNDEVKLPAVVDYNSSSSQAEAWYLGWGAVLVNRPVASTVNATSISSPPPAAAQVPPAETPVTAPLSQPTAQTIKPTALLVAPQIASTTSATASPAATPVLVAGTHQGADNTQEGVLIAVSFLTGLLVMRGSRVRKLLGGL